jgi:hypothetical protein
VNCYRFLIELGCRVEHPEPVIIKFNGIECVEAAGCWSLVAILSSYFRLTATINAIDYSSEKSLQVYLLTFTSFFTVNDATPSFQPQLISFYSDV